jgi:hypothetical protein
MLATPSTGLRGAGSWAVRWALLWLLWLALTDSHRTQELVAGAVAAMVAAAGAGLVTRRGQSSGIARGASRGAAPGVAIAVARRLASDVVRLAAALWARIAHGRELAGAFRLVPYPPAAGGTTPSPPATEWLGSLAPNRYVIGIDKDDGTALVHELLPRDQPESLP